jgi:hypothetical protein
MTLIKWDEELNEMETTEEDEDWYDYNEKRWANAKTKDGSYWVWIPRYAYKITSCFHSNCSGYAGNIEIKFLKGITNETADGTKLEINIYYYGERDTSMRYLIHPSFTFGEEELAGFWVAKFEPSGSSDDINIVPNASSLRDMSIGHQFDAALNMKNNSKYGWNASEVDTHMMKNTEWGAVAYLSQSEYGANEEIWNNSYNGYRIGCGGSSVNASNQSTCYEYTTTNGQKASTTHNIYGVYDMSGGAYDRVAAYVDNGHDYLTTYGQSIINADSKYKDVYISLGDTQQGNYEANKNKYGDAVYETSLNYSDYSSWYEDKSSMPYSGHPWFHRGGFFSSDTYAGVFAFDNGYSNPNSRIGFRLVVVPILP